MLKRLFNPVLFLTITAPLLLAYFYLTHEVDPNYERLGVSLEVAMINSLTLFIAAWFFSDTDLLKILFINDKKKSFKEPVSASLIIIIFSLLYLLNLQLLQIIVAHHDQTILDRGFSVVLIAALFLNKRRSLIICCLAIVIRLVFYFYHSSIPFSLPSISNFLLKNNWLIFYPGIIALVMAFLTGSLCRTYFIAKNAITIPPWVGFTLAMIIEPIYLGTLLKQKGVEYISLVLTTETVPNIMALGGTMTVLLYMLHGLHANLEYTQNKKAELAILQENLRYLRVQMNPHFLFNTLNTISHFISQDPTYAKELLLDFSDMFRHVVHDETLLVPLEKELEFIKMYLNLEKARLGPLLSIKYEIDPTILSSQIPTLILQPLVENAIKHGRSEAQNEIEIKLNCSIQDDTLVLNVTDNGKGMESTTKLSQGQGIGLKNIRKRLHLIYDNKAKLDIQSVYNKGTSMTVFIPINHPIALFFDTEDSHV